MAVNRVDFGGNTLIDLTGDTLESPEQLLKGTIAHAKDGTTIEGTLDAVGGYYIPSVDSDGNLSWTASKDDMPDAAGANIKGPKGDTGATGPQGPQGTKGDTGAAGYTPVRGVDYWTDADIAQIKSYVDDAILGGAW